MRKNILVFALALIMLLCTTIPGYASGRGYVNVDALNVRSQGIVNENSYVLGTLGYGEQVAIIGEESGWYKVVYNDMAAFVKKEYVTVEMSDADIYNPDVQYDSAEPTYKAPQAPSQSMSGKLLDIAAQHLGTPYRYGGSKPGGFDCSGFTMYCYKQLGININRTANDQMRNGVSVSKADLMPGDLVFFGSGSYASHVGMYVGDGMMIHSPRTGKSIEYVSINSSWYTKRYIGARRVL